MKYHLIKFFLLVVLVNIVFVEFISSEELTGWDKVPEILSHINAPEFRDKDYLITDFGASGNGSKDCYSAFKDAIEKCNSEGGGRVIVPTGNFFCEGPIHLKSNVNLHIQKDGKISFSGEPTDFLPLVLTRWEGTECYNYSPMIYAYEQTNIAITGEGTIDGGAEEEFDGWAKKDDDSQDSLRQMGINLVPVEDRVFGEGYYLRPNMIEPYLCENVLIEGVTINDSPFWIIHPTLCTNVTVRGVTVESWNKNNDGCDPEACNYVLIEDCVFDTGDDAIAIKAGRDNDAWRVGRATENVVIRNNQMKSDCNGFCIGSEMSGGANNIYMENCYIGEGGSTIYIKCNRGRGGVIENIWIRNIEVDKANGTFIDFITSYKGWSGVDNPTVIRNIHIEDVTCNSASKGINMKGFDDEEITHVYYKDITVDYAEIEISNLKYTNNIFFDNVLINGNLYDNVPDDDGGSNGDGGLSDSSAIAVNFQPDGFSTPTGYMPDEGLVFADNGDYKYGWNESNADETRDREKVLEGKYNTLCHFNGKTWEIELANGTYDILLVCGDATNTDQINDIDVEGTIVNDSDGEDNFDEYNVSVEVTDGKLTIKEAAFASNAKICFIEITAGDDSVDNNEDDDPVDNNEDDDSSSVSKYTLNINNGLGDGTYLEGKVVNIFAKSSNENNMVFKEWIGDIDFLEKTDSNITTCTMPAENISITAIYENVPEPVILSYSLTVINGSGAGTYIYDQSISIEADEPLLGQVFEKWTGDVNGIEDIYSAETKITMSDKDLKIIASYTLLNSIANINNIGINQLKIYPNPAASSFTIESENTQKAIIEIYDIYGKLVYNTVAIKSLLFINNHNLKSGIYLLKMSTEESSELMRLIIK